LIDPHLLFKEKSVYLSQQLGCPQSDTIGVTVNSATSRKEHGIVDGQYFKFGSRQLLSKRAVGPSRYLVVGHIWNWSLMFLTELPKYVVLAPKNLFDMLFGKKTAYNPTLIQKETS